MVIVNVIVKVGKQQKRWLSHKQCMVIVNVCGDCISKLQISTSQDATITLIQQRAKLESKHASNRAVGAIYKSNVWSLEM